MTLFIDGIKNKNPLQQASVLLIVIDNVKQITQNLIITITL